MGSKAFFAASLYALSLYGTEPTDDLVAKVNPELSVIKRADALPAESFEHASDPYLEGYIQALLDSSYYEHNVIVTVKNHKVYLSNLPMDELVSSSMMSFILDVPGVVSVGIKQLSPEEISARTAYAEKPQVNGVWFPQSTVLFEPLLGDPREPMYDVSARVGDRVMGKKAVAVSLGDDFPVFRWRDVFHWHGDLQIGVQAGVWAVFNFSHVPPLQEGGCELMNTDYLVGFPVTYAYDNWSIRARIYHISAHLGDEYLVDHPEQVALRTNPSFEAFEWISSYQLSSNLRMYAGPGWVFHSDNTFKLKPFYVKWGSEVRLFGKKLDYHKLYGTPFFVIHMENWEQQGWELNQFYMIGYEFSKLQGVGRKMRFYAEYHNGFSYEGQFFNEKVKYGQFGLSWGF